MARSLHGCHRVLLLRTLLGAGWQEQLSTLSSFHRPFPDQVTPLKKNDSQKHLAFSKCVPACALQNVAAFFIYIYMEAVAFKEETHLIQYLKGRLGQEISV